jgi:sugar phosphate permease
VGSERRWLFLVLGLTAQAVSCAFLYGLPFLLPELRATSHVSLSGAGALVAAPSLGLVATLIAWGAAADRYGERWVMALGLGLSGLVLGLVPLVHGLTLLGVVFAAAGAAGGSVNAASGRLVMGWFPAEQRGFAMGARQMAQPLGVVLAALVLPPVASAWGWRDALLVPAAMAASVAVLVAVVVRDPPRRGGSAQTAAPNQSPYRTSALWRVHAASALLVVPQFAVAAFAEEYLVSTRHWSSGGAGRVLALVGVSGALGRLAVGRWSDRVGSRLGPMRQIGVAATVAMVAVGLSAATGSWLVLAALAAASIISVTDNGLGFTATAELAGAAWAGRALGVQNTGQSVVAFLTPPLFGALVAATSYGNAFVACAIFPALGVWATPVTAERRHRLAFAG